MHGVVVLRDEHPPPQGPYVHTHHETSTENEIRASPSATKRGASSHSTTPTPDLHWDEAQGVGAVRWDEMTCLCRGGRGQRSRSRCWYSGVYC